MSPVLSASSLAPIGPVPGDSSKATELAHRTETATEDPLEMQRNLRARSQSLLLDSLQGAPRGNVLTISHPAFPTPESMLLSLSKQALGLAVSLCQGGEQGDRNDVAVQCGTSSLPFQDEVFKTVVLFHVIADGTEPELHEACRVLTPGGDLIVVGLNRNGWCARNTEHPVTIPRLRHGRLLGNLRKSDMEVIAELGAGLMGRARPRMDRNRWTGLGLTFADILLLRIRHRSRALPSLPRLAKFPARAMPTSLIIE